MGEKAIVLTNIYVGGDIPESKLGAFVDKALLLFLDNNKEFTYKRTYQERMREVIREQIAITLRQNIPLLFETYSRDGNINIDFTFFCFAHDLLVNVETAPFIDQFGGYKNHSKWLASRYGSAVTIPMDDNGNATTLVSDVFNKLTSILDVMDKPDKDLPLMINENGISGEVAQRRLAGEPLRKILLEVLMSRIDYPDDTLPPFTIIKGQ